MYAVSARNTTRGIAAHAVLQKEISDREIASQKRKEAALRHQLWIEAIDKAKSGAKSKDEIAREAANTVAKERLRDLPEWMRGVVRDTAEKHQVNPLLIMVDCRKKAVVSARNEVFYRIKERGNCSFASIGRRFKRDHTSVIHAAACHAVSTGEPKLSDYDIPGQRAKKAERARTQYLWKDAA